MPLRPLHAQLPMTTCVLLRGVTPGPRALTVHVLPRQMPPGDGVQRGAGCGEWPRGPGARSETPWGLSQKPRQGHGSRGAVGDLLKTALGLRSVRGLATRPRAGAAQSRGAPRARGGRPAPRQRVMKFCVNGRISRKHVLVLREQLGTDVFLRSELAKSSARPRLWGQEVTAEASSPSLPPAP